MELMRRKGKVMSAFHWTGMIRTVAVVFVVAIAVVVSLGAATIDVRAETKGNNSVANKTERQREACETIGGGTLVVMDTSYGNMTECKGGTGDGDTCFNTPTSVTCTTGDHDPSNANDSGYDQSISWQDVKVSNQVEPLGAIADGGDQIPPFSDVPAVAKEFSKPAYTSIKTRVQAQGDLCFVGGGTSSVSTENGVSTTSCEGGKQDGMTCTNTTSMTSCSMPRVVPSGPTFDDSVAGPTEVAPESTEPLAPEVNDEVLANEEPLTVDPNTEGDASSDGTVLQVDVVDGEGSVVPVFEIDEQP
jgi:hypothetical protein